MDLDLAGASGRHLLSLSAFGNVIIATTSNARWLPIPMLACDCGSSRLMILLRPPVRISESDAVLVDLAGDVEIDLGTGAVLWQQNVGSDVNVSPAVGAGVVVVMDRGGTTTAFEEARASAVGVWRCRAMLLLSSVKP